MHSRKSCCRSARSCCCPPPPPQSVNLNNDHDAQSLNYQPLNMENGDANFSDLDDESSSIREVTNHACRNKSIAIGGVLAHIGFQIVSTALTLVEIFGLSEEVAWSVSSTIFMTSLITRIPNAYELVNNSALALNWYNLFRSMNPCARLCPPDNDDIARKQAIQVGQIARLGIVRTLGSTAALYTLFGKIFANAHGYLGAPTVNILVALFTAMATLLLHVNSILQTQVGSKLEELRLVPSRKAASVIPYILGFVQAFIMYLQYFCGDITMGQTMIPWQGQNTTYLIESPYQVIASDDPTQIALQSLFVLMALLLCGKAIQHGTSLRFAPDWFEQITHTAGASENYESCSDHTGNGVLTCKDCLNKNCTLWLKRIVLIITSIGTAFNTVAGSMLFAHRNKLFGDISNCTMSAMTLSFTVFYGVISLPSYANGFREPPPKAAAQPPSPSSPAAIATNKAFSQQTHLPFQGAIGLPPPLYHPSG
jgi:hypothetical protein